MVTMGVFPFQGKTHMVEPGIEQGTSWLVVRSSYHQATRLVPFSTGYKHGILTVLNEISSVVRKGIY